jgi:hypothetical protein
VGMQKELKNLIETGEALHQKVLDEKSSMNLMLSDILLYKYGLWIESVRNYLKKCDQSYLLFAENIPDPLQPRLTTVFLNGEFGSVIDNASQFDKFLYKILEQINFLRNLATIANSNIVSLTLQDRLITNTTNHLSDSLGLKQNQLIISLLDKKAQSQKALLIKGIYADGSALSRAKDAVNIRLKKNLKIKDELIKSSGTGYFLNTKYKVTLEK